MSTTLPEVLAEIRAILKTLPGLNPGQYPSEQDEHPIVCLVYPGAGRDQPGSAHGGNGRPNFWQFDTIIIEIVTVRSDLLNDFVAVEPYTHLVPHAIMAQFSNRRANGSTLQVLGDSGAPGSQWPIRRELIYGQEAGMDVVGYRFELDVSYQVDIIHD